jgi:hypothetical protein
MRMSGWDDASSSRTNPQPSTPTRDPPVNELHLFQALSRTVLCFKDLRLLKNCACLGAALAGLLSAPRETGGQTFDFYIERAWTQNSPNSTFNPENSDPCYFIPGLFSNSWVFFAPLTLPAAYFTVTESQFRGIRYKEMGFKNYAELNAKFPVGGETAYILGGAQGFVPLPSAEYLPDHQPVFLNFEELQHLDPEQPFTMSWTPWQRSSSRSDVLEVIEFTIRNESGGTTFFRKLNPGETSVTIGAWTLGTEDIYTAQLTIYYTDRNYRDVDSLVVRQQIGSITRVKLRAGKLKYIPVPLPVVNGRLQDYNPAYPSGSGVVLGGVPFDIPIEGNNYYSTEIASGGTPGNQSLLIPIGQADVFGVHILMNTHWGETVGPKYARVIFHFSDGTAELKELDGGVDLRDFYNGDFTNSINTTSTTNVFATDVDGLIGPDWYRLDKVFVRNPRSDLRLESIELEDNGSAGLQRMLTAGLTLTVKQTELPLTARDLRIDTDEDSSAQLTVPSVDGYPKAVVEITSAPSSGILTQDANSLSYSPLPNFSGTDEIRYRFRDGEQFSNEATISVVVHPVNDLPEAVIVSPSQFISSNNVDALVAIKAVATDAEGDPLNYSWWDNGVPVGLTLVPDLLASLPIGRHEIRLDVSDPYGTTSTSFLIDVISTAQASGNLVELMLALGLEQSTRNDLRAVVQNATVLFEKGKLVAGCNQLRAFISQLWAQSGKSITPLQALALSTAAYRVIDTIGVKHVGDREFSDGLPLNPVLDAKSETIALVRNTAASFTLKCGTPTGTLVDFVIMSLPAHGTLFGLVPNLSYTPDKDYYGEDTFTWVATDGGSRSATAEIKFIVSDGGPAPVAAANVSSNSVLAEIPDETGTYEGFVTLSASRSIDSQGDPLTFWWYSGGSPFASGAEIKLALTPGSYRFELTAVDSKGNRSKRDAVGLDVKPAH